MIVTFYSFKGGVGRSMALANVARWLQLCGLNVTVVDWDLEAPGLESFFYDEEAGAAGTREQLGVIDLLTLYKQLHGNLGFETLGPRPDAAAELALLRDRLPGVGHALEEIAPPASTGSGVPPGALRLLGAGWRAGERFAAYANSVQSFDWNDFYASFHGRAYFEWLRGQLTAPGAADIVLIDSRTGVTEMGGVCTRQLADVVVVLSAPNQQNIDGASRMAASFRRPEVMLERGGRPLEIVMVPSRVDMSSEMKDRFATDFAAASDRFLPREFDKLGRRFWDLRIPYITKYAYQERLAIGEPDGDSDIVAAYRAIAAHVAWLAPEGSRVRNLMQAEFDRVFGAEVTRVLRSVDRVFARAIAALSAEEVRVAQRVLTRLVAVAPDAALGRDAPRQVPLEIFPPGQRALIARLVDAGLVRHAEGKRALIGLAQDEFVSHSALKDWVAADRTFLVWRQNLRTYLDDWVSTGREDAALLQGALLEAAMRVRSARPADDLLEDEHDFIARSEAAMIRRTVAAVEAVTAAPAPAPLPARPAGSAMPAPGAAAAPAAPASSSRRLVGVGLLLVGVVAGGAWLFSRQPAGSPAVPGPSPVASSPGTGLDTLLARAQGELAKGDTAAAIASYGQALAIDPRSVEALLGRANANEEAGYLQAALADLNALDAQGVRTSGVLLRRGKVLAAMGDRTGALAALDDAVSVSGNRNAEALFARGDLREALGQAAPALEDFRAAAALPGDERTRTAAQARAQRLQDASPAAQQPSATTARLLVSNAADLRLATVLVKSLQGAVRLAGPSVGPSPSNQGYVRYGAEADARTAQALRAQVEDALAKAGHPVQLRLIGPSSSSATPGTLEVMLPPLASPLAKKAY